MLIPQLQKILEALGLISGFQTVDIWQGDVKDLLDTVHKLPSAHVIFSAGEFEPSNIIGSSEMPTDTTWSVIVITDNRKDRKSGALDSLALLQTLLNPAVPSSPEITPGLVRLDTGYGLLWPKVVQLLGSENGKTAYGFKFVAEFNK